MEVMTVALYSMAKKLLLPVVVLQVNTVQMTTATVVVAIGCVHM